MKKIVVRQRAGEFAENKDIAKEWREQIVLPTLAKNEEIEVDFTGVTGVTQSFVHALIAEAIRRYGEIAFDRLIFSNTNGMTREIITTVYHYMQESLDN
jgi:hypothetical protein